VGLVNDQERGGVPRGGAQRVVETGLRVDDADVRQHRLGQHAGDVAVGQLAPKRVDVVPLDQARRLGERRRRAEVSGPRHHGAVVQRREGLVDAAVVAPVEGQDLRAAGQLSREPNSEAVRVRRRQR
jgi:hypothetical protein